MLAKINKFYCSYSRECSSENVVESWSTVRSNEMALLGKQCKHWGAG